MPSWIRIRIHGSGYGSRTPLNPHPIRIRTHSAADLCINKKNREIPLISTSWRVFLSCSTFSALAAASSSFFTLSFTCIKHKHCFQCGSGSRSRDKIHGQQFTKCYSHSPCYRRILKKTLLYSGFNILYKKLTNWLYAGWPAPTPPPFVHVEFGSGSAFNLRIRIQEGKNAPQK